MNLSVSGHGVCSLIKNLDNNQVLVKPLNSKGQITINKSKTRKLLEKKEALKINSIKEFLVVKEKYWNKKEKIYVKALKSNDFKQLCLLRNYFEKEYSKRKLSFNEKEYYKKVKEFIDQELR